MDNSEKRFWLRLTPAIVLTLGSLDTLSEQNRSKEREWKITTNSRHSQPSLQSCLFTWNNQTYYYMVMVREPSINASIIAFMKLTHGEAKKVKRFQISERLCSGICVALNFFQILCPTFQSQIQSLLDEHHSKQG